MALSLGKIAVRESELHSYTRIITAEGVSLMKIENITFDPPGDVGPGQGFSLKASFELSNDKRTS